MKTTVGSADVKALTEYDAGDMLTLTDCDRDADVFVSRPDATPLSVGETHATLKVATDDGTVEIELNGETLDGVIDALHDIQQFHADAD